MIVKPETVIRWHRLGFRLYWRWKSRRPGRPDTQREVRELIRKVCISNPTWGSPRVHGELLKLGIDLSQSTVSKYMVRPRKSPSQTWRTFLENHLKQLVSVDFFVVPTIDFKLLFVFLVLAHDRRRVVHFNVTEHPTAEWTAAQLVQAFPRDTAPRYLLRNRDHRVQLTDDDWSRIRTLARDLPAVWRAPTTTQADRKAMLRLVIEAVAIHPIDVPRRLTQIRVQWKSGAVDELTANRPGPADHNRTPSAAVEHIRQLTPLGLFDRVIAEKLNAEGVRSGSGRAWTPSAVKHVRLEHQIFGAAAVPTGDIRFAAP